MARLRAKLRASTEQAKEEADRLAAAATARKEAEVRAERAWSTLLGENAPERAALFGEEAEEEPPTEASTEPPVLPIAEGGATPLDPRRVDDESLYKAAVELQSGGLRGGSNMDNRFNRWFEAAINQTKKESVIPTIQKMSGALDGTINKLSDKILPN